jgi:hypothetical protein
MLFRRDQTPGEQKRKVSIFMSSRKPITLHYLPPSGEKVLLAKETTTFRGEVDVEETPRILQWAFEGENIENRKNSIRLEISY